MATAEVVVCENRAFAGLSALVKVETLPIFDPAKHIHAVPAPVVATVVPEVVVEPVAQPVVVPAEEEVPEGMVTIGDARKHIHGLTVARDQRLGIYTDGRSRYQALVECLQANPKLKATFENGQELLDNHTLFNMFNQDVKEGRSSKRKKFVKLSKLTDMEQGVNATERAFYAIQQEILVKRAAELQRMFAFMRKSLTDAQMYNISSLLSTAAHALRVYNLTISTKRPLTATSRAYLAAEEAFKNFAHSMPWADFEIKK